ncbi:jg23648 [Pararge aegeria aegeria]|uniref:Jg23648 protein n=1 Tax=Pararge aegeria aegeria TaxID=348720 RepID=A0A8S4QQ38_9NEOP|nr:jg23648 [Pararge aegeria aegeria]
MQSESHTYIVKHIGLPKIIHKLSSKDKHGATDILKPSANVEMKNDSELLVEDHQTLSTSVPLERDWAETCHNIYDSHFVAIKHEICSDSSDFDNTTAMADFSFENIVSSENTIDLENNELESSITGAILSGGYTQILNPLSLECMRMKSGVNSMKKDMVRPKEASIKPTAHVRNKQKQNNLLYQPHRRSFEESLKSSNDSAWKQQGTTAIGNTEGSKSFDSAGLLEQVSGTYKSQLVIRNGQSVVEKRQPVNKKKKTVSKKSHPVDKNNQTINDKNLPAKKKRQSFGEKRQPVIKKKRSVNEKCQPVKKKRLSFIEKSPSIIENSQPDVSHSITEKSLPCIKNTEETQPGMEINQSVTEESQPVTEKSQPTIKNSQPVSDRQKVSNPNKTNYKSFTNPPITKINLIYRRTDATRKYRRPIKSLLSDESVGRQNGIVNCNETDESNDSGDSESKDLLPEADKSRSVDGNRQTYTENRKPVTQSLKPIFDQQKDASSKKEKNLKFNKSSSASGTKIHLIFRRENVIRKYKQTMKSLSLTDNDRSVAETSHSVSSKKKEMKKKKKRMRGHQTNISPTGLKLNLRRNSVTNNYVVVQPEKQDQNKKLKYCELCDYKSEFTTSLVRHMSIHTVDKPYVCKYCEYKFSTRHALKIHTNKHTSKKTYSCRLCDFKCTHKSRYKCHMRTHTSQKPYSCKFCAYKCAQTSGLQNHMRTHTGEKPYSCKLCSYKCAQSSGLQNHMRTHTGEKPYSCKFCAYKCAQASGLQNHMRTHTGEKPYSCKFCAYKCAQASGLKNHMRTHTGEKPYSCKLCSYKCAQVSGLQNHMRKHTGD